MSYSATAARYRVPVGVLIGLVASVAVLSRFDGGASVGMVGGPLVSDCDGAIRQLVIHYVPEAAEMALPTYRDFLGRLPPDVTVHIICSDRSAFDEVVGRVGTVECELSPVIVGHAITTWSRDRWLALAPAHDGATTVLLCPRGEQGAEIWPARAGDQRVGDDLAAWLGPRVGCKRSDLFFDGGDFVSDSETVFVTPAVLRRNLQRTVATREQLLARLSAVLRRKVVLLHDAPQHHAGMFMMPVGDRTVLVGDPAAAERLLADRADVDVADLCQGEGPDFTAATIARFDAVARQCRSAGYRVVRIPIVPGGDGRTYLTYLNAILDRRDGRRIVYMPVFSAAEALNRAAGKVWAELGFEVRPVNCDACYPHFGSLRCLVNILSRSNATDTVFAGSTGAASFFTPRVTDGANPLRATKRPVRLLAEVTSGLPHGSWTPGKRLADGGLLEGWAPGQLPDPPRISVSRCGKFTYEVGPEGVEPPTKGL